MRKFRSYKLIAVLLAAIFAFTPIIACAAEPSAVSTEVIVSSTAMFGQPISVEEGTIYYASADFGGSGGSGIIGNAYTSGELFVSGYAFLDENDRLIDHRASLRDSILTQVQTGRSIFSYDNTNIASLWVGLYVEGCTNGAIGWVPATSTSLWLDLQDKIESISEAPSEPVVTPELEPEPEETIPPPVETHEPILEPIPESTPDPVMTTPDNTAPEEPSLSFGAVLWEFVCALGEALWAVLRLIGLIFWYVFLFLFFCIAAVVVVGAVVSFATVVLGVGGGILTFLAALALAVLRVCVYVIITLFYALIHLPSAIIVALFGDDESESDSAGTYHVWSHSQYQASKTKLSTATQEVRNVVSAGPSAPRTFRHQKIALILEASDFVTAKKSKIAAYAAKQGTVSCIIVFADRCQFIQAASEYLQYANSLSSGACLYQALNALPDRSFDQVIIVASGQDTSKFRGLTSRKNVKSVRIVSVNDAEGEVFESLTLELALKWGTVPVVTCL